MTMWFGINESLNKKTVVYLGTGTSFDLTTYPNYYSFTSDNFIIEAIGVTGNSRDYTIGHGRRPYVNMKSTNIEKSYSNGILSIKGNNGTLYYYGRQSGWDDEMSGGTNQYNINFCVWLIY